MICVRPNDKLTYLDIDDEIIQKNLNRFAIYQTGRKRPGKKALLEAQRFIQEWYLAIGHRNFVFVVKNFGYDPMTLPGYLHDYDNPN